MRLEIRDLESSVVYDVGPGGAVLGRERSKTDIALRDESISKRHARIFVDAGGWYLEDLGSSNGTFLDEKRLSEPVALGRGAIFSLAQRKFEVTFLEGAEPDAGPSPGKVSLGKNSSNNGSARGATPPPDNGGEDVEPEAKGFGYFLIAVPKAVAYYMARVPLMAVNPLGVIRKGIEELPLEAKGRMEIAAYAIPATIFTSLMGTLAAMVALAINGAFGGMVAVLIGGLPSAAIGGAIAGVVGYFSHPVWAWIVDKLKGESDPRSRTNFFIMLYTFSVLTSVPNALGTVLAALPIPFINLLGPLLLGVVSIIGVVMFYQWVKAFQLVKWVHYVVLVLGLLSVLGTFAGFLSGLYNTLMGVGGGDGSAAMADAQKAMEDAQKAVDDQEDLGEAAKELQKKALEAAEGNPEAAKAIAEAQEMAKKAMEAAEGNPEAAKAIAEAQEMAKKAMEAAQNNPEAAKAIAEAQARAAKMAEDAAKMGAEAQAAAKKAAAEAEAKAAKAEATKSEAAKAEATKSEAAKAEATKSEATKIAAQSGSLPVSVRPNQPRPAGRDLEEQPLETDDHPLGETGFVVYLKKRDAVEKAIFDEPALLRRKDVRGDYEKLWEITYDVREKYKKMKGERWMKDKILSHDKNQEVYEKTTRYVDRLYAAIFEKR